MSYRCKTTGAPEPQDIAVLLAPGRQSVGIRRLEAGAKAEARYELLVGPVRRRVTVRTDGAELLQG